MDSFQQRKQDVLSKEDKSSIGEWDEHVRELCEKINYFENYYTTSSCSGRIIVMIDQNKKAPDLFEFVSHELVSFENFKEKIKKIRGNCKFKSEPPILHIACKDLGDAEVLLKKAQEAGWKRSGIISLGKNIVVEILSTEKLEFPLMLNGRLIVEDYFLKLSLEKANENLKKGWEKIEKLKSLLENIHL